MRRRRFLMTALVALMALAPAVATANNGDTQGAASSDPDDNGKGPDRGTGGRDTEDGNNGCGNDSDRADDNEGWCGNKHSDGGSTGGTTGSTTGDTSGGTTGDTSGGETTGDPT